MLLYEYSFLTGANATITVKQFYKTKTTEQRIQNISSSTATVSPDRTENKCELYCVS